MANPVLDRLALDHQRIDAVMTLIEAEIRHYDDDATTENLDALAMALSYIESYPDRAHHPVEERLFDFLEAAGSVDVSTLRAQHSTITARTLQLRKDIENILNDIVTPITLLNRHLAEYVDMQRSHMREENEIAFPVAAASLSDADWLKLQEELDDLLEPSSEEETFNEVISAFEADGST